MDNGIRRIYQEALLYMLDARFGFAYKTCLFTETRSGSRRI
jgi:hypothetical protein